LNLLKKTMNKNKSVSRKRKRRKVLSPEERKRRREERRFKSDINTIFKNAGFVQIPTRDKHFEFKGIETELDNIYVFENIIAISEDTNTSSSDRINDHLRKKAVMYQHFLSFQNEFIDFLGVAFPNFRKYRRSKSKYETIHFKIIFVYCSRNSYEATYKKLYPKLKFLDYPYLRYFLSLSKIIHKSVRFELFKFLGLEYTEIGFSRRQTMPLRGFLLPEAPSGFSKDFKIVTFYIDPKTLIELSYVLRKDGGWRDEDALYQRLLIKNKIKLMRKFLAENSRVFINNIIVTLPQNTSLMKDNNQTLTDDEIDKKVAQMTTINLPLEFNTIGIIDGQHRIFSYHEGLDDYDKIISQLRERQNLLVTGIIYPKSFALEKRPIFESNIFLEINDKQSRVKSDLKQVIEAIVNPYEPIAISRSIVSKLAAKGALANMLELHFFETGKIKTSSIVSYGLKYIVRLNSNDSLYKHWKRAGKLDLVDLYRPLITWTVF
jgi:DGQHR domain-containing protein